MLPITLSVNVNPMSDIDQKILSLEEFVEHFQQLSEPEAQLRSGLDYMQASLNNKKPPYFKGFWEARKLCFPLFKEQLEGNVRAQLWNLYTELTREGRELKNILDQETTFAVEQIDLAIASLEKEVSAPLSEQTNFQLPPKLKSFAAQESFYVERQSELNRLNLFATRINGLRKELSKTEMRVRYKNKFFQRLSSLGDAVFPRRKELIREISEAFEKDIQHFIDKHFSESSFCPDKVKRQVFFFREEIKQMQACAKMLTINTHAFSLTREQLSACWDMMRGMEKEIKREAAQKRHQTAEDVEQLKAEITAFEKASTEMELGEACREANRLASRLQQLRCEEKPVLQRGLEQIQAPLEARRREKIEGEEKVRIEKLTAFDKRIESLKELDLKEIEKGLEECRKELVTFTKRDRQEFEKKLRLMVDFLSEKREEALLSLSDDARASLESLEGVLEARLTQRSEIKEKLEEYRKLSGGSALDIERAMELGERIAQEKERLAKCDQAILDIEQKIDELKGT